MFTKTLRPDTLRAIQLISDISEIKKAYLAGGTALALQLGHRMSVDLDFFTQEAFDENLMTARLSRLTKFQETQREWRTILGIIGETKLSIFYYKYPLLEPTIPFEGIQLTGLADIAAMKLHAITGRGTKRDFIDLYILAKQFSLEKMLEFYDKKYSVLQDTIYSILKGMTYFVEADVDTMPQTLIPFDWKEVKAFFRKEVDTIAKKHLQL